MSKPFRRISWTLGTLTVSTSVLANAYISHAKGFTDLEIKSMSSASQIQLVNGLGLCLAATRKTTLIFLPISALTTSTLLFSGIIFYSKMYKDYKYNWMVPYGGFLSIVGWATMVIC